MQSKYTELSQISNRTNAILVVVSDGFGGYGDFLLGLKLANALKQQYIDTDALSPEIYLVTQPSGKKKIEALGGDQEFSITILTPKILEEIVDLCLLDVGHIIETPILSAELMERVDNALINNLSRASLTQVTEYSYGRPTEDTLKFRKKLRNISYKNTIFSGFLDDEKGIIISHFPPHKEVLGLDEEIRESLMGQQSLGEYQKITEFSFQYSHDIHDIRNSALHFLKIYREFIKNSTKNHDIMMIGSNEHHKRDALLLIKAQLINDGFQSISFYNINTKTDESLYNSGLSGPKFRVLYTKAMSHDSIMACNALSGRLVGASGDQSFGEALSADKIVVYECLRHKYPFMLAYDGRMINASQKNPLIQEMLLLLRYANTPEQYERLGDILRSAENQALFSKLNAQVLNEGRLIDTVMREGLETDLKLRIHLATLLMDGSQETALHLFNANQELLTIFDDLAGKTMIQYALDNDSNGVFTQHFLNSDMLLLQYISCKKEHDAWSLIQEHRINPAAEINGIFILEHARKKNCYILVEQLTELIKQQILEEIASLLQDGNQEKALSVLKTHPLNELIVISGFDMIHGKCLLEAAIEHDPNGIFSKHFDDIEEVFFHCIVAQKYSEAAAIAAQALWDPYTKINKKYLIDLCEEHGLSELGADIHQRFYEKIAEAGINPYAWEVVTLLEQGKEQKALNFLLSNQEELTIFDVIYGESIITYAIQQNPLGVFCLYFEEPHQLLSQYIFSKAYLKAATLIREKSVVMVYPYSIFHEEYIVDIFDGAGLHWATEIIWQRHNKFLCSKGINPAAWQVAQLLHLGEATIAFENFRAYRAQGQITLFDKPHEKSLYELIMENDYHGRFASYAQHLLLQENRKDFFGNSKRTTNPYTFQTTSGFYTLDPRPIGKGGWSHVYSAKCSTMVNGKTDFQGPFAIKKLHKFNMSQLSKECGLFQKAYPKEFFEYFQANGSAYLVMPRYNGQPLERYLSAEEFLSTKTRRRMVIALLTAVNDIHEQSVIHHDIKPKNILYDPALQEMHIVDFGCAEDIDVQIEYENIITAKYAIEYMPPEYLLEEGTRSNPAQDIYSLCLNIAEILGLNKKTLVEERLERALSKINNRIFKRDLRAMLIKNATLDEALLSPEIAIYYTTLLFKQFIEAYVLLDYDFSIYQERLGEETVALLNAMQSRNPTSRPTIQQCLAGYSKILLNEGIEHSPILKGSI